MSENAQEKTFAGVFFNKVAGLNLSVFSCEFCKIFKNTFFIEHLQTTASENNQNWQIEVIKKDWLNRPWSLRI